MKRTPPICYELLFFAAPAAQTANNMDIPPPCRIIFHSTCLTQVLVPHVPPAERLILSKPRQLDAKTSPYSQSRAAQGLVQIKGKLLLSISALLVGIVPEQ